MPRAVLLVFVAVGLVAGARAGDGVPTSIKTALARGGVNLQFDFYDVDKYNPHGFDAELPLIAAAGAGHVRLPISMDVLEQGATGALRDDRAADVVGFVRRAQAERLVTIVDIHNTGQKEPGGDWTEDYMGRLRNPAVAERHIRLLSHLAAHLSAHADTDWFVLQPANEPIFGDDPKVWYDHQARLLRAMRQASPTCVFTAVANDWQGIDATVNDLNPTVAPYNDPRLIFDVHLYDPMSLTHCAYPGRGDHSAGLTWPGVYKDWRGEGRWDRARLAALVQPLAIWRDRHGVTVHFSEIGTAAALAEDVRAAYLGDLTSVLRAKDMGYTVYEWRLNFGVKQHPKVLRAVFRPDEAR